MITGPGTFLLHYLKNIDIKSYEFPWDDEYWNSEAEKSILKLWMKDGKPYGFTAYRFVNVKNILKSGDIEGTIVHILKLAVHPDWRNKGIGAALLRNIEEAARLQKVVILVIILHEENSEGRDWIIKRGFKGNSLHLELFPDGRDGYGFLKRLES